jgi:hypothetical protein
VKLPRGFDVNKKKKKNVGEQTVVAKKGLLEALEQAAEVAKNNHASFLAHPASMNVLYQRYADNVKKAIGMHVKAQPQFALVSREKRFRNVLPNIQCADPNSRSKECVPNAFKLLTGCQGGCDNSVFRWVSSAPEDEVDKFVDTMVDLLKTSGKDPVKGNLESVPEDTVRSLLTEFPTINDIKNIRVGETFDEWCQGWDDALPEAYVMPLMATVDVMVKTKVDGIEDGDWTVPNVLRQLIPWSLTWWMHRFATTVST